VSCPPPSNLQEEEPWPSEALKAGCGGCYGVLIELHEHAADAVPVSSSVS
jgi:hypothetical protein